MENSSFSPNEYLSPSPVSSSNRKRFSNQINKSLFYAESPKPKSNIVKGVFCPKTNTFYSTQEPLKPPRRLSKKSVSSQFWDTFDDFLTNYQNPKKLHIELKQIM